MGEGEGSCKDGEAAVQCKLWEGEWWGKEGEEIKSCVVGDVRGDVSKRRGARLWVVKVRSRVRGKGFGRV